MKFRVLFLKRKQIYYFLFIVVIFLLFGFSVMLKSRASYTTFTVGSHTKSYKKDLNGDGKEDVLYITLNKNKYYLQVNTENDSTYIEPNKNLPSLGNYSVYWPMRVKLVDITRDNIPEIFIQSSQNNKPIQHGFLYKNNDFKDIFCNYNNVLGFIDYSNNKTPKVVSGKISQGNFTFSNYILLQNKLEEYQYNAEEYFMGKNTILHLIGAITVSSPENIQPTGDIFDHKNYDNAMGNLIKLSTLGTNFIFQDATFIDTRSNKKGEPSQIEWILNFRGNPIKSSSELKNYTLKVNLKAFENSKENYYFKVFSITLQK